LSYLLDAIAGVLEPTDTLALERKALVRSWFYLQEGTFFITETVMKEVVEMRACDRRDFHESFVMTLFNDYPVGNADAVARRARDFKAIHREINDCHILAESEELGIDVLLTYDNDFRRRLANVSPTVRIMTPCLYWDSLGIPRGALPRTVPHHSNPLSAQTWWRW
jgi:predicted nucleic acid-binding protein